MQFSPTDYATPVAGFKAESCFNLDYSLARITHAVSQLGEADVWWRPYEAANAPGNLLLHVCGNMRQWIVNNLTGQSDDRERPDEFAQRDPIPRDVLLDKLRDTVEQAKAAIQAADEAELMRVRYIQIAEVTGMGAVYHSVSHLEGHTQELIYIARLRLGTDYQFRDAY